MKRRRSMMRRPTKNQISKLVHSLRTDDKIYGSDLDGEFGELARTIEVIRDEIDTSEINLHTMMMERERQEYLMRTIDNAAFALLAIAVENVDEFDQALREGLSEVAQCVNVDGIYVWRNMEMDGQSQFDLQVEWSNIKAPRDRMARYTYDDLPGWEEKLSSGYIINSTRSALTEKEKTVLSRETQSILILPVVLHEHFWGLVFFEDFKQEREFTQDDVNLLQSASLMIVSAVRRKKQAARINEANARVRLMMDSTPIGCFLWGSDMQVFDCNPASLALFKAKNKEDMMANIKVLAPVYQPNGYPSDELSDEYLTKAFLDGHFDYEWTCCAFDGTLFPVEISLRRVQFEGKYVVAEYIRDIREQKRLMYELESRGRELELAFRKSQAASQAKTNFLSNMSHEIRTPLNAITGMAAIGESADTLQKKDDAFKKIVSASSHLMGVINDILDMSKIEAGKLEVYEEAFDLEKTLSTALNIVLFKIEEKNQIFSMELDESVPPVIVGDDQRLTQVLTNLLGNAVKFTPEGKEIKLVIKALERSDTRCVLQFSIIDQGIGISKKQQERLFSSFTQAEASTTRKFGGTGLGLAISKHIIEELMGGRIWVESELGSGAAFSFSIDVEVKDKTEEAEQPEDMMERTYPGKVLLLAEDVDINREIVAAILEPTEVAVEFAENGVDAVRMFHDNPGRYSMIFMDVQMPIMDGFEASRKIRDMNTEEARTIPIVAMTANVFREDVEQCIEAGMDDHLGKPLDFDAVIGMLWKYL